MQLAAGFLHHAGPVDDTPHLLFSSRVTQEHREPLVHIEAIGLGPAVAALDLHAGRVDSHIVHPLGDQGAVEPDPITAGLIATHDTGRGGQAKAPLGACELLPQPVAIACGHAPLPRPLGTPVVKPRFQVFTPHAKATNSVD